MFVVIGSSALLSHLGHTRSPRLPRDVDLVGSFDDVKSVVKKLNASGYPLASGKKYVFKFNSIMHEVELTWDDSTAKLLYELVKVDPNTRIVHHSNFGEMMLPSMNILYMLKMSHRYRKNSVHFLKTMKDIHFMRSLGAEIEPRHLEFFKIREKETYSYGHPKLNVNKMDFFNVTVPYVYDHDSIHEAVKHLEKPAYSYFKPNDSEVMTDRKMFDALPETTRLYSVLEESYVLALERSQIPHGHKITPEKSFLMALSKVCTSITSGWWREFAWENYDKVLAMYSDNYVDRFETALRDGVIKPYQS